MSTQTKRPAFQWYPGDAQRDTALRSLPLVVRGLWREMLDVMHDGAPYGHLTTAAGAPIATASLARMVGEPERKVAGWLAELEAAGVFSRTEAGVIYSRRMVRDEHNRAVRAAGGRDSLRNPNVPRPKSVRKDATKDRANGNGRIPSDHPSPPSFSPSSRPSLGGSPAVALAVAPAVQEQEQEPPPADAVGATNGRAGKAPKREAPPRPVPKFPHFPSASCDRLYEAWVKHRGGIDYARFRKAFGGSGLFPPGGPSFTDEQLERAIEAAAEISGAEGGFAARTLSPETFVANVVEWVRLGGEGLIDDWGAPTERGRRAGVAV